jgi:2'-5' RNA ligase
MNASEVTEPDHYRLFIALAVPEDVKDRVERAQQQMRRALRDGGVKWTPREQFHLTLSFLGNVPRQAIDGLASSLQAACRGFGALRLQAAGVGFFPNARRPRVIWVGMRDADERLAQLAKAVQEVSRQITGEAPEERFAGHLTLGRVKELRSGTAESLARAAEPLAAEVFGDWRAGEARLMRSELSSQGARHSVVSVISLETCT